MSLLFQNYDPEYVVEDHSVKDEVVERVAAFSATTIFRSLWTVHIDIFPFYGQIRW